MASFGWKRKRVSISQAPTVQSEFSTEDEPSTSEDIDWLTASKRSRGGALEDAESKAHRLKSEGIVLAESGRYWEAIRSWDEAISLSPSIAQLHEMKTQALLELREDFAAVKSGEEAVRLDPIWSTARQTLGRALLNMGELQLALKNFCIALHLEPWSTEIREEDINWTLSIMEKTKGEKRGALTDSIDKVDNERSRVDSVRLRSRLI